MNEETLGQRITRLRDLRRWSQKDLAAALGVSVKTVSNWERDRNHPRNSMAALRELFGSAIDDAPDEVEDVDTDPVMAAIARSGLEDWRQDEVRFVYRRNLSAQRQHERGAAS